MKLTRLTREDGVYRLTIYELGKRPTYIRWELGSSIATIGAPGLPRERSKSLHEWEVEKIRLALEMKKEKMMEEVLYQILKDTLKKWRAWGK